MSTTEREPDESHESDTPAEASALETEQHLIEHARADRASFGRLYDLHAQVVLTYLLRRTGDRHVSEDLASETFLRALAALDGFKQRGVPFRHWLLRIATNLVANWSRSARRVRVQDIANENDLVETRTFDAPDEFAHVRAALAALPERYSSVLALHYIEGLEIEALARLLDCRPATVRTRLHRGRERLRRILEHHASRHGTR